MMIDAVMYGMIPRAKRANWVSAPPENSCRKPSTPPPESAWRLSSWTASRSMPGGRDVRADPVEGDHQQREEDLAPQVGDPEHVPHAGQHGVGSWSAALPAAAGGSMDQRLANWLPWTGGRRSPHGLGRTSTVPPAAVMAASAHLEKAWAFTVTVRDSSPRPRTLMSAPLWAMPLACRVAGLISSRPARLDGVEVDALVLDAERVVEALQLRDPHVQRHLTTLEAGGDAAAGLLALGAAAGGLAALAGDAAADALLAPVGARHGLQIVDLDGFAHQLCSSTETRCGTRASIPRISGRSGRVFDLPMRPRPSARSVPRCLGLRPDGAPDLGDDDRGRQPSRDLFGHVGLGPALAGV